MIAISRALGDWEYKNPKLAPEKMAVSGYPDISKHPITATTEFIICACDGIWDCMTSQQACDFVKKGKLKTKEASDLKVSKQSSTSSSKSAMSKVAGAGLKKKMTLKE